MMSGGWIARSASFETPRAGAPQDDESQCPPTFVMLRSGANRVSKHAANPAGASQ